MSPPASGPAIGSFPEAPSIVSGVLAGALATVAFAVIHGLWIADIWSTIGPMVVSGAACGWSIVSSYRRTTIVHSWGRWAGYNAACAALLVGLGGASFLTLDPRFTMAEMMEADDALARLLPPAMPLIVAGTGIGAVLLWLAFGRRKAAILPILVTQALLMFLVGHNLAILGLVDIPTAQLHRVAEFVGVTVFLAAAFATFTVALEELRSRLQAGLPVHRRR